MTAFLAGLQVSSKSFFRAKAGSTAGPMLATSRSQHGNYLLAGTTQKMDDPPKSFLVTILKPWCGMDEQSQHSASLDGFI